MLRHTSLGCRSSLRLETHLPTPPQPDGAGQRGAYSETYEYNSPSTHELPFSDTKIPASAAAPPTIPIIALIMSSLTLKQTVFAPLN